MGASFHVATLKINQTLSSIQTQALALPISTVLAGIKLSDVNDFYDTILINAGIFVFSIISSIIILSQIQSIRYIEKEFDEKMSRIKSISVNIAQYFGRALEEISKRAKFVRMTLYVILIVIWICELMVLSITYYHHVNSYVETSTHNSPAIVRESLHI